MLKNMFRSIESTDCFFGGEDIILENSYHYNNSDESKILDGNEMLLDDYDGVAKYKSNENYYQLKKYLVINSLDALKKFSESGEQLYEQYKKNHGIPDSLTQIINYYFSPREKNNFKKFYTKWIKENTFPYTKRYINNSEAFTQGDFLCDSLIIFIVYQYQNYYNIVEDLNNKYSDDIKSLSGFKKYKTPLEEVDILANLLNDYFASILINTSIKEVEDHEDDVKNYFEDLGTEYFDTLRLLIKYLNHILSTERSCYEFKYNKLIYSETNSHYYRYTVASSLVGIAYDRLLQNFIRPLEAKNMIRCALPYCQKWFPKKGKQSYCNEHSGTAEAKKYSDRLYNSKRKDKKHK